MSLARTAALREMLRKENGIVLDAGKEYLVELRLRCLATEKGFDSIDTMIQAAGQGNLAVKQEVCEALCTNETLFFREQKAFKLLREDILPRLLASRGSNEKIRIWSAACSTAQEPYSIAMMLQEAFPSQADRFTILASDFSTKVLKRAAAGTYSQMEVSRGLSKELLHRYFRQDGDLWTIDQEIRKRVEFKNINLTRPWNGLGSFDVVMLCNVLIYFDSETRTDVLNRLNASMHSDGYLLLSGVENMLSLDTHFTRSEHQGASCYLPSEHSTSPVLPVGGPAARTPHPRAEEQRSFSRSVMGMTVRLYTSTGREIQGHLTDLSGIGFHVVSETRLDKGEKCTVHIGPLGGDEGPKVIAEARVTRLSGRGMGMVFTRIPFESLGHIQALVLYNSDDPDAAGQKFTDGECMNLGAA